MNNEKECKHDILFQVNPSAQGLNIGKVAKRTVLS